MRIFVAGATGAVGFQFTRLAKAQGHFVHTFSRSTENARKLVGLADKIDIQNAFRQPPNLSGIDIVVSALGAPVTVYHSEKRPYHEIDFLANQAILESALTAQVKRFLYVAAHSEPAYQHTAYIRAHEAFARSLRQSNLSATILRPTGIYAAFHDFVDFAHKGLATVIGPGDARTNPVHQADVAQRLMLHLEDGPTEESIGGPDILTRRQIVELPFRVLNKRPRVLSVPPKAFGVGAKLAGLVNTRLGELFEFVNAISTTDCLAPSLGKQRLEDYFRSLICGAS